MVLAGAFGLAVGIVMAGAVGSLSFGGAEFLGSTNGWGVPRWAPAAMSLLLAFAAVMTWGEAWVFRILAAHWAIGAAAMARPGVLVMFGIDLQLGLLCIATGAGAGILAATLGTSRIIRGALWAACLSPAVMVAAIMAPEAAPIEIPADVAILGCAALSVRARLITKRPWRT